MGFGVRRSQLAGGLRRRTGEDASMWPDGNDANPGIRLGRIGRIEVWVHWLLLAILALLLLSDLLRASEIPAGAIFLSWGFSAAALFASLLVHELAHCRAARRLGGIAHRIVLWPLGGFAACDVPADPKSRFHFAAAGPVATILLFAAAAAACAAAGWDLLPVLRPGASPRLDRLLAQHLVLWNAFLLLSFLPCTPQDGGRMLEAGLERKLESAERARAVARKAGHAVAALALVAALSLFFTAFISRDFTFRHPLLGNLSWGLLFVVMLHAFDVRKAARGLGAEEEDTGVFGYDFSRGYASLETTVKREPPRVSLWARVRTELRRRAGTRRRKAEAEVAERVDRLLEKIHREGLGSLTRSERRFLVRASRRYRK